MAPRRILIVYGSHFGQTAKIATRIADALTASGASVTVANASQLPPSLAARNYDVVVVGSSVEFGRHQKSIARFVAAERGALVAVPTAFFSVSGAAAEPSEAARAQAHGYVDAFLRRTGWRPTLVELFGGAAMFTRYNPLVRWIIKRGMARSGGPTDTTRDYEFTDWAAVQRFAEQVGALAPARAPAPAAV